jgi:hypothetical protein
MKIIIGPIVATTTTTTTIIVVVVVIVVIAIIALVAFTRSDLNLLALIITIILN